MKPHILIFNPDQWRGDVLGHVGNPAAGVACALALRDGIPVTGVNLGELRETLRRQGAAVI